MVHTEKRRTQTGNIRANADVFAVSNDKIREKDAKCL
jgi:hypothetical protein